MPAKYKIVELELFGFSALFEMLDNEKWPFAFKRIVDSEFNPKDDDGANVIAYRIYSSMKKIDFEIIINISPNSQK